MLLAIKRTIMYIIKSIWGVTVLPLQCWLGFSRAHKGGRQAVVFIAVPTHGNLGDQAIVFAQRQLFASLGMENQIVEIPSVMYVRFSKIVQHFILPEDIIVIDGGGNLGTLWLAEEHKMQHIVALFHQNPIIIFPQTIYYDSSEAARQELIRSQNVYQSHPRLVMCAREEPSFLFMQKHYPKTKTLLLPDMVLSLQGVANPPQRDLILLCLREDHERILNQKQQQEIASLLDSTGLPIKRTSTVINKTILAWQRKKQLFAKWREFASARLVVTDRLHAMIFAAINGTPCIAFDNSSGKVGNVYPWLSHLPYITVVKTPEQAKPLVSQFVGSVKPYQYDNTPILGQLEPLVQAIKGYRTP